MSNYQRGEARPHARLKDADVLEIRRRHAAGDRLRDLAAAYPQVSKVNLHHIVHGRRWRHLLGVSAPGSTEGVNING